MVPTTSVQSSTASATDLYRSAFARISRGANGGARFAKGRRVRIHEAKRLKSEIAHGPSSRSDVKRVARGDQDDAQAAEINAEAARVPYCKT